MQALEKIETIDFPTRYGDFDLVTYKTNYETQKDMKFVLVISKKDISNNPLIRIHSSCLFGDTFGSLYCDCREQLERSLVEINKDKGILFYLDQEGRSHGLINKVRELRLQIDENLDTQEASIQLGLEPDSRDYQVVADILHEMNISQVRLLTNNPDKIKSLESQRINVERVSIEIEPNPHNLKYQSTKKKKFSHLLDSYIN